MEIVVQVTMVRKSFSWKPIFFLSTWIWKGYCKYRKYLRQTASQFLSQFHFKQLKRTKSSRVRAYPAYRHDYTDKVAF